MTKLGTIDFDDCIIDALRDNRLVVFAGAGVSMGAPSNLASFWYLACDIAKGSGFTPSPPLDRFLGQLQHRKVDVHERAVKLLSPPESAPNALHHDLLRLFRTADSVRVVTTNFDLHFEAAAKRVFGTIPDTYQAPALPLGYDFTGIVHLHGALPRARQLVLTDADFGRAYLTEGWARRFLVDVFRHYTVLFIGYSHDDVVMNYLARALPVDSVAGRFALSDRKGDWELLGITPIHFEKCSGEEPFKALYDGVHQLTDRNMRGALDWQSRLAEIGSRIPPTDEEAISEVEQALREVHTTRFLLNVARSPEWLRWLNGRKHLDALFSNVNLSERERLLVDWLVKHFVIEHSSDMFNLVVTHNLRINRALWWSIGSELRARKEEALDDFDLKRWVTIMLASVPDDADVHANVLLWLAECSGYQGCTELTLIVFMAMSEHRLKVKQGFAWSGREESEGIRLEVECPLRANKWALNKVWIDYLKPHLPYVGQSLLLRITSRLELIYGELSAWNKASHVWDPISYRRSAIEPHEQDRYPNAIDVLIDAARDTIEWFAEHSPSLLNAWVEILVASDIPLLRRLAIHAITVHPEWSSEDRLRWLVEHACFDHLFEHHEVYRAVALNYQAAAEPARKSVVDTILSRSRQSFGDKSAEMLTARLHFDWLMWLLQAKPDCALAGDALAPIKAEYPIWRLSEHPDFTHWMGTAEWVGTESPWSVEQLLSRTPNEQLDELLNYKPSRYEGLSREGGLTKVREACTQNSGWAFTLGRILTERCLWSSDLWPAMILGLQECDLSKEDWQNLLTLVSNPALQSEQANDISNLIYALVRDGGRTFALDLLEQANSIALPMWQALEPEVQNEETNDWVFWAINHPSGVIVDFWLSGLSLLMRDKTGADRIMPDYYRQCFTTVVQDFTTKGGVGRCLLASQTAFLYGLDETWASKNLVPLFRSLEQQEFAPAWVGFLRWGRLSPALVDALLPAFFAALPRIATELGESRQQFIEFYTEIAVFHVLDPTEQLLPKLFLDGSLDDRLTFASHLGEILGQMQSPAKQQLWNSWLSRYWEGRLQGVLATLDETEIHKMLEWLPQLGDAFPVAVGFIARSPIIQIEHSYILHELCQSELVMQFPTETANLLIYLSRCIARYQLSELAEIEALLPELPVLVRRRLDEAFAHAGVVRRDDQV